MSSEKTQPWKTHWPATEEAADEPSHGCPKGAILYPGGDTVSKPKDRTVINTQEQPWKEHWPAGEELEGAPSHACPAGTVLHTNGDTVSKPKDRTATSGPELSK